MQVKTLLVALVATLTLPALTTAAEERHVLQAERTEEMLGNSRAVQSDFFSHNKGKCTDGSTADGQKCGPACGDAPASRCAPIFPFSEGLTFGTTCVENFGRVSSDCPHGFVNGLPPAWDLKLGKKYSNCGYNYPGCPAGEACIASKKCLGVARCQVECPKH